MSRHILESWLDELVMCGWSFPISRRRALQEMMAEGWERRQAILALCWFKAVRA